MSSNLKVNTILPSVGSNIGLGTGGGNLNVDGGCKVQVGTALTLGHSVGVQFATQNLHSAGFEVNNINADCIYRMNFNLTYNQQSEETSPWHVDHDFDNKVLLVYLTKFSGGQTAVDAGNKIYLSEPKEDKIITFDGNYKHCAYQPKKNERRVVLNCTYLG